MVECHHTAPPHTLNLCIFNSRLPQARLVSSRRSSAPSNAKSVPLGASAKPGLACQSYAPQEPILQLRVFCEVLIASFAPLAHLVALEH